MNQRRHSTSRYTSVIISNERKPLVKVGRDGELDRGELYNLKVFLAFYYLLGIAFDLSVQHT